MINLDKFIADILYCIGIPYVSPGYTGTRDVWKDDYDKYGKLVKVPAISGIDCSGLLVRAYAIQGESLYHGSNYIARNDLIDKPHKLTSESQLQIGMAVFKWSSTGQPSKYTGDGQGNFHHIGIVTSIYPLTITHASSAKSKVVQDDKIKGWTHFGRLKAISKEDIPTMIMQYKVISKNGDPVRVRAKASTSAATLTKLDVGTIVTGADSATDGWTAITSGSVSGYMMSEFLELVDAPKTIQERVSALQEWARKSGFGG